MLLNTGSRVPGSWHDLWHFSQYFGKAKDITESTVKKGYKRNQLQNNKWCIFIILVRIWIEKKMVELLAHDWLCIRLAWSWDSSEKMN